jgi:hypothetical protein
MPFNPDFIARSNRLTQHLHCVDGAITFASHTIFRKPETAMNRSGQSKARARLVPRTTLKKNKNRVTVSEIARFLPIR